MHKIGGDIPAALESIGVPSYVIDPSGVIRWLNPAAIRLVGDVRGRQFTSVVAPEETRRARELFARKLAGTEKTSETSGLILDSEGNRINVEVCAVSLMEGHRLVGVFGQVTDVEDEPVAAPPPHLTPRQVEILRMLHRGASTHQIARDLHLSTETVRNHVRALLRALGVSTRLEAVAATRFALPALD